MIDWLRLRTCVVSVAAPSFPLTTPAVAGAATAGGESGLALPEERSPPLLALPGVSRALDASVGGGRRGWGGKVRR